LHYSQNGQNYAALLLMTTRNVMLSNIIDSERKHCKCEHLYEL